MVKANTLVPKVRRADPAARRQAILLVAIGGVVGALLILGVERYRPMLRDWILSDPGTRRDRARLVLFLAAALLSAPLVAFAGYLWLLGSRILGSGEFPPPGYRVLRDTPVSTGRSAVLRGRGLEVLAVCLAIAAALLWLLLWYCADGFS